jgi:hypothetical protein
MKKLLMALTAAIFVMMVYVTVRASLQQTIWETWASYSANPWAVATLYDAYSGFTLFWLYTAWRERTWPARILWFVLIMALGNIATAGYLFLQLARLRPDQPVSAVLERRPA